MGNSNIISRVLTAICLLLLVACSNGNNDPAVIIPDPLDVKPVIFVHGQSGSAQQFQSQAMRFTSNGYPQDMLFAFEYDTSKDTNPLADLDAFVDKVLAVTGARQVYAIGHSRGTSVWTSYLDDPEFGGAAKVARYVNIDGRAPEELPGGVPTIGIWGEWNSAGSGYNRGDDVNTQIGPNPEDNYYFPDKSHSETATAPEAFALMYEFLTGVKPTTTEVAVNASGSAEVVGRAVIFPENIGFAGTTVQVWLIDSATGHRQGDAPLASFPIDASGDFGPVQLDSTRHYEFAVLRAPNAEVPVATEHHIYAEPFVHDDYFFRLQTSYPGQSLEAYLPSSEDTSSFVVQRQREFWGDQGALSDELFIDGLNVLTPDISPRALGEGSGVNLALFVFDYGSDKMTDLDKGEVFPFNFLTFLTGADVFIPAMFEGGGTVSAVLVNRGGREAVLNVPNWPSNTNRISLIFNDYPQ